MLLGALILIPGIYFSIQLHPYEYTYFNSLTGKVYRIYDTDYWLTCYKESIEWVRANHPQATLYVQREPALANYYSNGLNIQSLDDKAETDIHPGDLLLFSTRADLDIRSVYRKLPVIASIGRQGADFCLIKRKE